MYKKTFRIGPAALYEIMQKIGFDVRHAWLTESYLGLLELDGRACRVCGDLQAELIG